MDISLMFVAALFMAESRRLQRLTHHRTHVVIKLPSRQQALSLKITPGNKCNWKYFSSRPAEGGKGSKKICAYKERKYAPLLYIVANEKAFNLISLNKA